MTIARIKETEMTKSRPARWAEACQKALDGLSDMKGIQEEYEEWRDNVPENAQSSPVYDKLETICALEIESAVTMVEEAQDADLPLGFGRD